MRKSLTTICAVLLVAGLAACNRGGDNASDDAKLNAHASQQDNLNAGVVDTSPDDATANAGDVDQGDSNIAANAVAPGNTTGNRQ